MDELPPNAFDVFLQPGDYYFGDRNTRIRTILGSCVSIVMWHPKWHVGGMCHFMLPQRRKKTDARELVLDGRYADEAMTLLLQSIASYGSDPGDYEVKLFGGGSMFPSSVANQQWQKRPVNLSGKRPVGKDLHIRPAGCENCAGSDCTLGCLNSHVALHLANEYHLNVVAHHLGGVGHRQVIFDVWSGYTWVKQHPVFDASKFGK
ncbi:hypothetical protein [Leeia oryzae]|uniref:hypothetical protein n=1 Tax=Leeia oryzae TaxID=356662 RepID=UPI00037F633B|nr:hypothetical protein [Leeia oryzae]